MYLLWQTKWLIDLLIDRLIEWLNVLLVHSFISFVHLFNGWPIICLRGGRLINKSIESLNIDSFID